MGAGQSNPAAAFGNPFYPPTRRRFLALCGGALAGAAVARFPLPSARADDAPAAGPRVRREDFGKTPDGTPVDLYVLTNGAGVEARVMTYGATLTALNAPDRAGKVDNLTLYFDTVTDYVRNNPLFGATVGRFANRISNSKFTLDGNEYKVTANAGRHHIHGGNAEAFHRVVWKAEPVADASGAAAVRFTHVTKDGDAGYPGTVEVSVTYKLTRDNELVLDYTARTDKATPINLTNHSYWNLAGAGSGDVLGHVLTIHSDQYLDADRDKIPSGKILPVKGTPQDFNEPTAVGARIAQVESKNYDHCYLLATKAGPPALCARVVEPKSGRVMEVFTTQPAVQLYTAAGLNNRLKGGGKPYGPYHGLCLETEHYPDSPNRPEFPSSILRPGKDFHEVTVYKFSVEK